MTDKELIYFIAVVEQGSISKAARILYVSQPSITQTIRRIEEEIGTPLLLRTTGGVACTEQGKAYYQAAVEIMGIWNRMKQNIKPSEEIRVGLPPALSSSILSTILFYFNARYPSTIVDAESIDSKTCEKRLLDGSLDLAILHTAEGLRLEKLLYIDLYSEDFVLMVPAEYVPKMKKLAVNGIADMNHLPNLPIVMFHPKSRISHFVDPVIQSCHSLQQRETRNTVMAASAVGIVSSGKAIAIYPQSYVPAGSVVGCFALPKEIRTSWILSGVINEATGWNRMNTNFIKIISEYVDLSSIK